MGGGGVASEGYVVGGGDVDGVSDLDGDRDGWRVPEGEGTVVGGIGGVGGE